MQRYSVTIVSPGTPGERPTLLVPFEPTAQVKAFLGELWKRVTRRGLPLEPNTHIATLHLDGQTGEIEVEDALSHVITDPKNVKLLAVFTKKDTIVPPTENGVTSSAEVNGTAAQGESIRIRVVTAAQSRKKSSCPVLDVPVKSTLGDLHNRIAQQLSIPANLEKDPEILECNCQLCKLLADCPGTPSHFFVVHSKSEIERLPLDRPTEPALMEALRRRFVYDVKDRKKVILHGAVDDFNDSTVYKKPPVVAICSKERHIPAHARTDIDETSLNKSRVIDMHTTEHPIHPGSMSSTIKDTGLSMLAVDGVVDIYVVRRLTSGHRSPKIGKSSIYRSQSCWEPEVAQSERGRAMFLSSLRVFASLVKDMKDDERLQDAVLHVLDLLTQFPPATRAFYLLASDKTPTAADCAAVSHAAFQILDDFMPEEIFNFFRSRLFEGSRLLFGFILEKARNLKLPDEEGAILPYLTSYREVDLRDYRTDEAVKIAVQTPKGLIEASLFHAFEDDGILAESSLQQFMTRLDIDMDKYRLARLAGGATQDTIAFSRAHLFGNYRYPDAGNTDIALDLDELAKLDHLSELCGTNKLAVCRPADLASAIVPCLTFDRKAHLAVYLGQEACGHPGQSTIIFRPLHGEETINTSVVEQLIAPILKHYADDGTAVFDALGGAAIRRLQAPDEILYFAVDTSASMREASDFADISNDDLDASEEPKAEDIIDPEFYNMATLDDMKEQLCRYEGFPDMVAIIADFSDDDYPSTNKSIALDMLVVWRTMLASNILQRSKDLEERQQHARDWYPARRQVTTLETELRELKTLYAGLKTHEEALCDFLIYRATTITSSSINQRWTWSIGDAIPVANPAQNIPTLDSDITDLPYHLRCPISQLPMEDAVRAADGHTYSRSAIRTWFRIRTSSPMTGLQLNDSRLEVDKDICDAVALWIDGDGIPGRTGGELKRLRSSKDVDITFDSKVGSFKRSVSPSLSLEDLYTLAFRGLKAKFVTFQLHSERRGTLSPLATGSISSFGIVDGDHLTIRIPDDDPVPPSSGSAGSRRHDMVLVKVYGYSSMMFAYWVKKDTMNTLSSVLWKYCRHTYYPSYNTGRHEKEIWTALVHNGDNRLTGQVHDNTKKLSTLFNSEHCFGTLNAEKVYRDGPGNNGIDEPLVLKLLIDHRRKDTRATRLTRLDVLKQMFEALVNRTLAYNYKTHIGLITFSSTCQVKMGISNVLENFRATVSSMEADGDTALWDALALADDQLNEYSKKYPEAKKRIICISDGVDTKSSNKPEEICWRLQRSGTAMDTVSLGDEQNVLLRTIPTVLGCYRFHPTSLVNALAITEMEPFLSLSERPTIEPLRGAPKHRLPYLAYFLSARGLANPTIVTTDRVPPRKEHPNLHDDFVELAAAVALARSSSSATSSSNAPSKRRISRLLNEIRQVTNTDHPTYDIYVSETDISFWKVVISGPAESPYENGSFLIYVHADESYPTFAPKARFVTKIKHPNVNMHGRICHSIFDRDWTSDISMSMLLDTIYGLLYQPEYSDPVNTTTTLGFHHDQVEFADEVREHVRRYASTSRAELKKEILGEDDSEDEDHEEDDEDESEEY